MRSSEGFSLVELILVIAILGILAVFVGPVLLNAVRAYTTVQTGLETQGKLRYAMERMSRELREIRRQATDAALLDLPSMTGSSIAFFKTDGTQVVISQAGSQVTLAYSSVAGMLADQVSSFSLAYLQQDATTPAASAASVAYIEVGLSVSEGASVFPARVRVDVKNPQ